MGFTNHLQTGMILQVGFYHQVFGELPDVPCLEDAEHELCKKLRQYIGALDSSRTFLCVAFQCKTHRFSGKP